MRGIGAAGMVYAAAAAMIVAPEAEIPIIVSVWTSWLRGIFPARTSATNRGIVYSLTCMCPPRYSVISVPPVTLYSYAAPSTISGDILKGVMQSHFASLLVLYLILGR